MLYYDRIDIFEGNNVNQECGIFHYWYYSDFFKFQPDVCNRCHNVLLMSIDLSNIVIWF